MLKNDEITVGHAKALAGIDDEDFMIEVAERAANGLLTVRNIERIAAEYQTRNDEDVSDIDELDKKVRNYYTEVELSLTDRLGRKVKITPGRDGKGSISIDFFNKDDLSGIADLLKLL